MYANIFQFSERLKTGKLRMNRRPKSYIRKFENQWFRYSEIIYFALEYLFIFIGIFVKALQNLRCVAAFTNVPIKIIVQ